MTIFCFWIPTDISANHEWKSPLQLSRLLFLSFLSVFTDPDSPSILQEAEVLVFDRQVCEQLYNPIGSMLPESMPVIQDDEICAGDIAKTKDSCKVRVCSEFFLIWDFNFDLGFPVCKQQ